MRKHLVLLAFALLYSVIATAEPQVQLIVAAREYPSGKPLAGVKFNVTLWLDGRVQSFRVTTNRVGVWTIRLPDVPREAYLLGLSIGPSNYTGFRQPRPSVLVRVADVVVEEVDYRSSFEQGRNVTAYTEFRIPLLVSREGNASIIRFGVWLAPGRPVNVTSLDPVTRRPVRLSVKPGVPIITRGFLLSYLMPVGYPVLVSADTTLAEVRQLRFWISNETSVVPWSYHAAEAFLKWQLSTVDESLKQLESIGYSTDEFRREAGVLRVLAQQALFFFERGNYTSAVGALLSLVNGANSLKSRVEGLFSYSQVAALGIILLTLSFAHTFSMLFFERGKSLYTMRLALLTGFLLAATLSSPTMRLAIAGLLGALGIPLAILDIPTLVAGTLVMGFLAYGLLMLVSLAAGPVRGFWLYLAIRYMKSKRLRTILVLSSMTLVIASTLAVSGVTLGITSTAKTGRGAGFYGLDIEVNTIRRPMGLNSTEVEWLKATINATDVGLMATVPPTYLGVLVSGRESQTMILSYLVALDIPFAARHFNLTAAVYEGRLPRTGAVEVILPKGFAETIKVGDNVWLFFAQPSATGPPSPAGPVWDTPVKVVGFFDPMVLNSTLDPELRPLFGDLSRVNFMVIAPYEPFARRLSTSRLWLLTKDLTTVRLTAELTFSTLPVTVHVLEGSKVTTYERTAQVSFRGAEAIVLLVVAALMNASVMLGHVEDRRKEVYTMATLGADPKGLFNSMLVEASIIGIIASYLGWLLAPLINSVLGALGYLISGQPVSATPLPVESLFYASGVGLTVTLVSAYIPSRRASGLSRMGREERKVISASELKVVGGIAVYELPIRVSIFESEGLYRYLKEILPKKDIIGEEVYLDGTFATSFAILPPHMRGTFVTCRLRTVKRGDSLILQLEVPEEYKSYMYLSDVIYALETKLLDYSKWRDSQFRYQILRYAPRREALTLDALLERCRDVIAKAREMELKLKRLEEMKASISTSLYSEYEKRYRRQLGSFIRELLTLSLRLEPFVSQLREEIRKLEADLEKHKVAYELGELGEVEYMKVVEPIEKQLEEHRSRLKMIDEVNEFLASRRR